MINPNDFVGRRFGKLTVLEYAGKKKPAKENLNMFIRFGVIVEQSKRLLDVIFKTAERFHVGVIVMLFVACMILMI